MTNIVTQVITSVEVGIQDIIAFFQNKIWPTVVAVTKDIVEEDLKAILPIATAAVSEIAADASNLTNPTVIGQLLGSVLTQAAGQAGQTLSHTTVTTAAVAVASALQAANAAVNKPAGS